MKQVNSTKTVQRGFSLVEAMISVLLVAVLGLGIAYATSRALLTQRYATTQNLAIIKMREYLQTDEEQSISIAQYSSSIDDSSKPEPPSEPVTISIGTISKDIMMTRSRSLIVTSADLFSGDGTVSLTY